MKNKKTTKSELAAWKKRNQEINEIHQLTAGKTPTNAEMQKSALLWEAYKEKWGTPPSA